MEEVTLTRLAIVGVLIIVLGIVIYQKITKQHEEVGERIQKISHKIDQISLQNKNNGTNSKK